MKPSTLFFGLLFICTFYTSSCHGVWENYFDDSIPQVNNCSDPATCPEAATDGPTATTTASPRSKISNRPRCKNITLTDDQFVVSKDVIFVPGLNRSFSDWTLTLQGVQVCTPFSEEFMGCKRWLLRPHEFQLSQDGLKLIAPIYNRVYEPSDFYIRKKTNEAVVCINVPTESAQATRVDISMALGTTWIISAISLIIAGIICVALAIPTTYRVVLPFYMLNLFVAYVVLMARLYGPTPSATSCFIYGVVLHFSLLSAFFWLNVVAFHVWRSVTWVKTGVRPHLSACVLAGYIIYGWGSPFLISLITFLVEAGHLFPDVTWLRPEFHSNCWFGPRDPMLVFFYGPMAAILMANVAFFILTIVSIQNANNYYSYKKPSISQNKLIGTALHLIVVMGLCWIMEALSWAIGGDPRYWLFTDLLTGLQGFFVLVVVIVDAHLYNQFRCCGATSDAESNKQLTSDVSIISIDEKSSAAENK